MCDEVSMQGTLHSCTRHKTQDPAQAQSQSIELKRGGHRHIRMLGCPSRAIQVRQVARGSCLEQSSGLDNVRAPVLAPMRPESIHVGFQTQRSCPTQTRK